jgi:hypothetical protein
MEVIYMERIFNKIEFDSAKLYKKEVLEELNVYLKSHSNTSILDMDVEEVNKVIADKLKDLIREKTVSGCFISFANKYAKGIVAISYSDTIKNMIAKIADKVDIILDNIR